MLNQKNTHNRKNILVFPCGSEIALEIHRSLKDDIHYHLIGASSVDDHGRFVFQDYISNIPYVTDESFIPSLKKIIKDRNIAAIYPALDFVISIIKKAEMDLGCKVITSPQKTVDICLSKGLTYDTLRNVIKVPIVFNNFTDKSIYPVFCKFDIGYGGRGARKINTHSELMEYLKTHKNVLVCECLTGDEYTIDCFTNRDGKLLFYGPRIRKRVSNGISVNTIPYKDCDGEIKKIVDLINNKIRFRGAWFVQLKRDKNGVLTLLEIAARLGGSSSLFRAKGVNFALMSIYDAFDVPVSIIENDYNIEMDRALDNIYKIEIDYDEVYCDFDDCCVLDDMYVNTEMVSFLYKCLNKGKKITLLSRHYRDLQIDLKRMRLESIFDRVVHIKDKKSKADYIDNKNSIFIDDSFSERKSVHDMLGIPVFSVDMIGYL